MMNFVQQLPADCDLSRYFCEDGVQVFPQLFQTFQITYHENRCCQGRWYRT